MSLTKKEKYIIENFKVDIATAKAISEIGRIAATHKYDVWIAKEAKKDKNILSNQKDIFFIIDWAKKEKPNISSLEFEQAFNLSKKWHKNLPGEDTLKQKEKETKEANERIVFKCGDKKHFFLLLKSTDLNREGKLMGNCVGSYKSKVKSGHSLMISLRDEENLPHVTMEVDVRTGSVVQIRGKGNTDPAKKYLKMITEFALFATGYGDSVDKDLLRLMKMRFS